MRCSAHVLNIIVQEGLKVASDALQKIRESIKYVRGSEARKIAFKECVMQVRGIDSKVGLRMDVPTRWNSSYLMLESAIRYRHAFGSSSYPTSNRYFMQVWKIECLLLDNVKSDDLTIKDMSLSMMNKFSKYWDQYCDILAIATILDPRMKFEAIRFCYRKINHSTCAEKINFLKDKMYKLFEEYVKLNSIELNTSCSEVSLPTQPSFTNDEPVMDAFDEYVDYLSQHVNDTRRSELDLYLDEGNLDPIFFDKLDVLSYWRDRRDQYPNLSKMACDILSILITTVASESAFSLGSRVLTKYRSSILPENVEALILTQNWLQDFELTVLELDSIKPQRHKSLIVDKIDDA
ncbi:zinc finger BED domain-containing protein RICESLEEPER 3-like [Vigna angularis]|uniref:zinc finger BED domain-containing protein RICESLEEPER 3-like n=1 Tax=Phaseolus angularis TaxID=3914 RepID=UPI00080A1509|nr:zinc finger BED domain-containing protein RICESLEEPER 3-like [Vigna angularis]